MRHALIDAGFNVTQATVSRDIRALNLTKMVVERTQSEVCCCLKMTIIIPE